MFGQSFAIILQSTMEVNLLVAWLISVNIVMIFNMITFSTKRSTNFQLMVQFYGSLEISDCKGKHWIRPFGQSQPLPYGVFENLELMLL